MRHNLHQILIMCLLAGPLAAQEIPRLRIKEQRARALFEKGLRFYHDQQYVAAREFLYQSLNIQPYFHLARRYLGDAYYYSGEWQGALEQWEFLNEITGNDYPLIRQRSELLRFQLNDYRDAGNLVYLDSYHAKTWSGVRLDRPVDLAMDRRGRLYILNFGSHNLIRLDNEGSLDQVYTGGLLDPLKGPMGLALTDKDIWITDYNADLVRVLRQYNGDSVLQFGESGRAPGRFYGPGAIYIHKDKVYVCDTGNRRIQVFDRQGRFLQALPSSEAARQLQYPSGLVVINERLYVADRDQAKILVFDASGNYLETLEHAAIQKPGQLSFSGGRLLVSDIQSGLWFYDFEQRTWQALPVLRDKGNQVITIEGVMQALQDQDGRVFIADYKAGRIWIAAPRGLQISNLDMKVQKVDTARFPLTGVFLTVHNRLGHQLRGLGKRDILLFENDQRIGGVRSDNIEPYNRRIDTILVKEDTELFKKHYDQYLAETLQPLLESLRAADRLEAMLAGVEARTVYTGLERLRLLRMLQSDSVAPRPNYAKALMAALDKQVNRIGPRSVILIVSGANWPAVFEQFGRQRIEQYARANGVQIHIISYEGEADPQQREAMKETLAQLAEATGGQYFRAFDENRMNQLMPMMRAELDPRYILTYDSKIDAELHNRFIDLRVEVHHMGMIGKADGGFFVP
ncbi:MAG: hypothetical protein KDK39_08980 [Leptospiraceae bacterium]|nr:hypothetical protein [Leptospiraceae bacterium]